MMQITIEDRQVHEALTQHQKRVADLSPVMADIAEMLHTLTDGSLQLDVLKEMGYSLPTYEAEKLKRIAQNDLEEWLMK
jgi:hypothetical protein